MEPELGVTQVAERIRLRLQRYIEAQYHIRDSDLIEERKQLLVEPGGVSTLPYVESTPSYEVGGSFKSVNAPDVVRNLLDELAGFEPSIGVFPPYAHQVEALEDFFADGDDGADLIVATGTGSGKTETFLYPILGLLALEASERPESFAMPGIRALLLYPMNALVSDQTARLRRMLGDPELAKLFRQRWGRHARFGMYTSRTPYPGVRKGTKDQKHLQPLLEHYERLETSSDATEQKLATMLKKKGKWPAKDVVQFFAKHLEEQKVYKTGKKVGRGYIGRHWGERFLTQPSDRELLTRHEMHLQAPDLLITNYSMLEYMLLRPIERPLFNQTQLWLKANPRNRLLLILDEAHMYRGVGGAEVGLLLRRLTSRLGIDRDRLRCILTSASLGKGERAESVAVDFARGLTGERPGKAFRTVSGTLERREGARSGTSAEAQALARVAGSVLGAARIDPLAAYAALATLATGLGWGPPPNLHPEDLAARQYVARNLTGFGPFELLIKTASGRATKFPELARVLFPDEREEVSQAATDALFALGSFSRRTEPGRSEQPLLPARVHMFFRGLPPLYACINPVCSRRRHNPGAAALVGRFFTGPRTKCGCGGRVFELLTHRDCGAAYLRAYATDRSDFLWHERGGALLEFGKPLVELHILLEEPHHKMTGEVDPILVDIESGRIFPAARGSKPGTRLCFRARAPSEANVSTFASCPACTRRTYTGGSLKIMDLATKGEQPFANLVREQFVCQVASAIRDEQHPNEGRKALLFSDGRQKAARLARDLPREVERDSFREALVLAVREINRVPERTDVTLDNTLYTAFIAVCARFQLHFFDGKEQSAFLAECRAFTKDYGELGQALDADWRRTPRTRYRQALLRQIADPYYSLVAACAGVVQARDRRLRVLERRVGPILGVDLLRDIANAWIREMLSREAFDPELAKPDRQREFPYWEPVRRDGGLKRFFEAVGARANLDSGDVANLRQELFDVFTQEGAHGDDSGRLLLPDAVTLRLAMEETWLQCTVCGHLQLDPFLGACANVMCGERKLEGRSPEHPYMKARKGFFREPLKAVLEDTMPPVHITAEEHTAQLSQRDSGVVYATTEEFELRFQDIPLGEDQPPVDVLSCTTTMEVGIDIGSLTAVSLRTVPPQRENYQQRSGRAGRRGAALSSVVTFAQGGSHDAHYFANPALMISGEPREPRIKSDNRRLARRHVHSHLLQTFFHESLDRLSAAELKHLGVERPGIMSALGSASDFFQSSGPFSHNAFDRWIADEVLVPTSAIIRDIADWLPRELERDGEALRDRESLAREFAQGLQIKLRDLRHALSLTPREEDESPGSSDDEGDRDDDAGSLLELLFDEGVLPSYAFPTDLCSFFIQEWADRWGQVQLKERPQLAKSQALSEYAPGRLLVVNKETYRVGGVFAGGPPTSAPALRLFAGGLRRYVGCTRCTYVRLEGASQNAPALNDAVCPVCVQKTLLVKEFLDPPGFSPEKGWPIKEGDREQEITYASTAQLPELAEQEEFRWIAGPGTNMCHAYGVDIPLVVTNKGKDSAGFSICESCGAAWLAGEEEQSHCRPFLLPESVRQKENAAKLCTGVVRQDVFLGHDFKTDILVLRIPFRSPIDYDSTGLALRDALTTLAEAMALGASLHLDIDPGEVSAGIRFLPRLGDEDGNAEVFLYDTASGGAGYAAQAGEQLSEVLQKVEELLDACHGQCERSCTLCLRHYGNRFLHARLDRRLALDLLRYGQSGQVPQIQSTRKQTETLAPLRRYLELEGWRVADPSAEIALDATSAAGARLLLGTYPCLLKRSEAERVHPLSGFLGPRVVLLPDYLVEHDLPSAYSHAVSAPLPTARVAGGTVTAVTARGERVVELEQKDILELARGGPSAQGTLRLQVGEVPKGSFAVRVPSDALRACGFSAGSWIVLRPFEDADCDGQRQVLVLRREGSFRATKEAWTVAAIRRHDVGRLLLSYSRPESVFRPERTRSDEVTLAGTVVAVGEG